jgi:hypothetical protein
VTGERWKSAAHRERGADRDCFACGCLHDEALAAFPELAPIVAVHLSDVDGVPMHAEANGRYHVEQGNADATARLFRCDVAALPVLPVSIEGDDSASIAADAQRAVELAGVEGAPGAAAVFKNELKHLRHKAATREEWRDEFARFTDAQLPRWKAEADAARAFLDGPDVTGEPLADAPAPWLPDVSGSVTGGDVKEYGGRGMQRLAWPHRVWRVAMRAAVLVDGRPRQRSASFTYKTGLGITDRPTVGEVLGAVLEEARGYENADGLEDWAAEYGFDLDEERSKAERIYGAVGSQCVRLRRLLGDDYERALDA